MPTISEPDRPTPPEHRYGPPLVLAAAGALLVAHAVLAWMGRPAGIETGGDDAKYLLLAQALRHFSYAEYWQLGLPTHSQYPPGYPVLLALWSLVAGWSFSAQVALSIAFSVAALAAAYLLTARHLDARVALLALAILAFNRTLTARAGTVASELPYALWSMVALLAALGRRTTRNVALAAAFAILAALTRSAGLTLVAALVLALALERRWRAAVWSAVAAAATLGPWLLWTALAPNKFAGVSYVADALSSVQRQHTGLVGMLAGRLATNASGYAVSVVVRALPIPDVAGTRVDSWLWLVVACVGLAAGLVAAWQRWRPVVLYLLLYSALLLVWPWPVDRFLEPVDLLAAPLWLYGLWTLARMVKLRRALVPAAAAAALVVGTSAYASVSRATWRTSCGREIAPPDPNGCLYDAQRDWMAAARWVRDSTPADAAVVAEKPGTFYYYTRRRTLSLPAALAQGPARFADFLRDRRARYVVLTTVTVDERSWLAQLLAGACRDLSVAAEVAPQAYVLRLRDSARDDDACAAVATYRRAVADSLTSRRWR